MKIEHQKHELELFINDESQTLILGSFPSVKSREYGFYYSHNRNRFYIVLSRIFNEPCPISIEYKKEFLRKHYIALYDVIEECDIDGSSDSSISNVTPIDIKSIFKRYPNIKTVGVTGKKAASLFDNYLVDKIGDIKVIYLPSTSPANAKMSVENLLKEYKKLFE